MTNETVFVFAVVLSILTVLAYLLRKGSKSDIKDGLVIFFSCSGVATGIQIFCLTFSKKALGSLQDYKLYLVIGGFSVIWVSVETIIKCFKG